MTLYIRLMLIVGSLITSGFMLYKIRKSKVQIEDSIFWLLFSAIMLLLSLFPQIAFYFSSMLGFEAPINFIYLVIIFIIIVHQFWLTIRISQTNNRLKEVIQRKAIDDYKISKKIKDNKKNDAQNI